MNNLNLLNTTRMIEIMLHDKYLVRRRFYAHKYRFRDAGIEQDVTLQQMFELFENHNGICDLCDKHMEFADTEIDHIISISNDGPHTIKNMQMVHKICNSIKRDKDNDLARWLCKKRDSYRYCRHCDCIKPLTMWADYYIHRCVECQSLSSIQWSRNNRDRVNQLRRERYHRQR